MVWVCLGLRRHCKDPRDGTKRRNFEVGNTSTSATRRKLNVGQSSSHTQAILESSSQPVTENAPLFDCQQ
ncbi:hypothetical protein ACOSQ2_003017 [Xanthoceras sorbifolium]